ncbi:MAG TPA: hypothetical protein VGF14_04770 [Alphaproteobacteria bacterium]
MSADQNKISEEEMDRLYNDRDDDGLYGYYTPTADKNELLASYYNPKPDAAPPVVTAIEAETKKEGTAVIAVPAKKKNKTPRKAPEGQLSLSFEPPQPDVITNTAITEITMDDSGNDEENLDSIFLTGNPQFGETEKELQRKLEESTALTKQMQEPSHGSTMDNVAGNMIKNYTPPKRKLHPHRKIADGTQSLYATPPLTFYVRPKTS